MANAPTREDFTGPSDLLVQITPGKTPDASRRVQFTAFWLDGQVPGGVRGQVFNTNLDDFMARERRAGVKVRVAA